MDRAEYEAEGAAYRLRCDRAETAIRDILKDWPQSKVVDLLIARAGDVDKLESLVARLQGVT